jgi:hypothetical protein
MENGKHSSWWSTVQRGWAAVDRLSIQQGYWVHHLARCWSAVPTKWVDCTQLTKLLCLLATQWKSAACTIHSWNLLIIIIMKCWQPRWVPFLPVHSAGSIQYELLKSYSIDLDTMDTKLCGCVIFMQIPLKMLRFILLSAQ